MPWPTLNDAPRALRGAGLNLTQANEWGRAYDMARAVGADQGEAAGRAWVIFKRRHVRRGAAWMKTKTEKHESLGLTFLESFDVQNPKRLTPNPHAGRLAPENRAYHVTRQLAEGSTVIAIYEGHALVDDAVAGLHVLPYAGTGQSLRTYPKKAVAITEADAAELVREFAEHEHARFGSLLMEIGKRNNASDEKRIADLVNLGLDLLGPESEVATLQARRAKAKMAAKAASKTQPVPLGTEESIHVSGSSVIKSQTATTNSTPGTGTGGGSGYRASPHLSSPPWTSETATKKAHRVLMGEGTLELIPLHDEFRDGEVQDSLFALANELDMIATTRLVLNRAETVAVLERAKAALKDVKVVKIVDDPIYPNGVREETISPEDFWSWGLEDLAKKLEGNGIVQDWLMIESKDCKVLAVMADNLRKWIHVQRFPRPLPEDVGDATREMMDLFASEIQEGRDPRGAIRARMATLMEARMATCPHCGAKASKTADECPSCGESMDEAKGACGDHDAPGMMPKKVKPRRFTPKHEAADADADDTPAAKGKKARAKVAALMGKK